MTRFDIKLVKAGKEYECLSCTQKIPKGKQYYSLQKWSHWLVDRFEEATNLHPLAKNTLYEVYVHIKFCSEECHEKFLHRRRKGNDYILIRERWKKEVGDAYKRRLPKWKKLSDSELDDSW